MFSNLVLILQVSNNGYKYSSWTMQRHNKQSAVWSSLSENVKKLLQFDKFVRNGQIITKLVARKIFEIAYFLKVFLNNR